MEGEAGLVCEPTSVRWCAREEGAFERVFAPCVCPAAYVISDPSG